MYDVAIIGAGWAGFNAAIRAKKLGLKTVLVDKDRLGGTCLNLGCIPTKTLIQSAKISALTNKAQNFGIKTSEVKIDFAFVQERKDKIIQQLAAGMKSMLSGIDYESASAELISPTEIKLADKVITSKNIIIAVGSLPQELTNLKFDSSNILSSNEILALSRVPSSLLIVGGGVIGCEFASLFASLGAKVTIVEKMSQLIPGLDKEISRNLETVFKKKGIEVKTDCGVESVDKSLFEKILVCVGRIPNTQGLGLESLGIVMDKSRVVVDEYLATNIGNIYACGDCSAKIMLAHFASYQGSLAVENIARADNRKSALGAVVPSCIFSEPQIACVGLNEDEAVLQGIDVNLHKSHFLANGMARIIDEAQGFIKIISDKKTGIILGSSIIGPQATELISTLTLAVSCRLNVDSLRKTILPHPSLSEIIAETLK
jgi:dihydrolipoamide dehydrogenase